MMKVLPLNKETMDEIEFQTSYSREVLEQMLKDRNAKNEVAVFTLWIPDRRES